MGLSKAASAPRRKSWRRIALADLPNRA
jgi:hypothetical protein